MEGAKQNGKPFRGKEFSSLAFLQRSCPEFLSAIASGKEHSSRKGSNGASGSLPEFAQDFDAMIPLQQLLLGANGAARPTMDRWISLQADAASAAPTTSSEGLSEGLSDAVQDKNGNNNKQKRRDGVSPLTNPAASTPPSFAASTSSRTDENNNMHAATSASGRSRSKKKLSEAGCRQLEALLGYSRTPEDSIPDELVANFDRIALLQLLQQCSSGVCVSLGCAEGGGEEQNGLNYNTPPASATANSSSSSSSNGNGGNVSIGRLSQREFQAQLSAAVAWASSTLQRREENDDDDDNGVTVRLPRDILETASQIDHPSVVFELLNCENGEERGADGALLRSGKNNYADASDDDDGNDEDDDDDEEEYEDDASLHDEDLDDVKEMTEKVSSLCLATMKELVGWWNIQLDEDNEDIYRKTITEHIRLLAFTICAVVSNTLDPQAPFPFASFANQSLDSNKKSVAEAANSTSDMDTGDALLQQEDARLHDFFRLRHTNCRLSADHLRYFANIFGFLDHSCPPEEDIYNAISAVGVTTFFSPLPTPLLEKVCHELSIPNVDEGTESVDTHQLPDLLAEKISHYFYPPRRNVPSIARLQFMPQMQIHEHAPGRYTCTVDNPKLMKAMMLQRLISNRFSCNKIRWHALMTVIDDNLSFYVWHRNSDPLAAHMIVRTQDPKKKRKNNGTNGGDNKNKNNTVSPNPEPTLRETSALFLEKEGEAAPGELIGFENFVSLTVALQSSTMSQSGYRLYNRAENRLVFQYAMDLMHPNGAPLAEDGGKKSASNQPNGKSASAKRGTDNNTEQGTRDKQATNDAATAENEKRRKEREELVLKLEKNESQQRDTIEQAWNSGYRQLVNEHSKSYQKALQKKKERERQALLAKVGPSPELLRELETLTRTVTTYRAQVAKLAKEKSKEEAAIQEAQEKIEEGKNEVENLQQQLRSSSELLSSLEAEAAECAARRKERQEAKRRKQQDLPAELRIPDLPSSTRHETLAINDLQSFWAPSFTNGTSPPLFPISVSPTRSPPPQSSPPLMLSTSPGVNLNVSASVGPNGGNGSFMHLPTSTMVVSGEGYSPTLQPSVAGMLGVGMSTWGALTDPLPYTTGVQGVDTMSAFDGPSSTNLFSAHSQPSPRPEPATHIPGADIAGGAGAGKSGGFTVTAPFSNVSAVARFTLDANACPFTPTSMVTGKPSCNTVAHPSFPIQPTAAPVSAHSPHSTSPMTGMSVNSPAPSGVAFPERPRYTSVSTPVGGGLGGTGALTNDGLQNNNTSLFALPGLSNGSGTQSQSNTNSLSFNFTTAPWN